MAESTVRNVGYDPVYNDSSLPSSMGDRPRFPGENGYHDSYASSNVLQTDSVNNSTHHLNPNPRVADSNSYSAVPNDDRIDSPRDGGFGDEKFYGNVAPKKKGRSKLFWFFVVAGIIIVILAVLLPLLFLRILKKDDNNGSPSNNSDNSNSNDPAKPSPTNGVRTIVTGGDGSEIVREDGSKFTYRNSFGGQWYFDPNDPFNMGARPQSWSPALNETFVYGRDIIRGVNIGGWLNTEPFISPALYEAYSTRTPAVVDEFTLSQAMREDTANGGINQLEDHYRTFIVEDDIAEIAAAGLNYVCIPIGYWAVEVRGDEPFLERVSWTYFLKGLQWCRKYGLRVNLDLHALPGSQNGWNHSGRIGTTNFLNGPMGYANAQRALDIIRVLAEFISQPQYRDLVTMFGIMNEPQGSVIGQSQLQSFYLETYNIVRSISGVGAGNGPIISFHDGFAGWGNWAGFMPGADRVALDVHPYFAFGTQNAVAVSTFERTPCTAWAAPSNASLSAFGLTTAGEHSLAINDCGLFLNGVGLGNRFDGTFAGSTAVGSCQEILDWPNWSDATKASYLQIALSSFDALQNFFFWTWKIGYSTEFGRVMTPHWSYQLGLQQGWLPRDPRDAIGACGGGSPFDGTFEPHMTGAASPAIPSADPAYPWPPVSISGGGVVADLPSYVQSGTPVTLPPPTFTITQGSQTTTADAGNGWHDASDTAGMFHEVPGCSYLDPWVGSAAAPPVCGGGGAPAAVPTAVVATTTSAAVVTTSTAVDAEDEDLAVIAAAPTKREAAPQPALTAVPLRHR